MSIVVVAPHFSLLSVEKSHLSLRFQPSLSPVTRSIEINKTPRVW